MILQRPMFSLWRHPVIQMRRYLVGLPEANKPDDELLEAIASTSSKFSPQQQKLNDALKVTKQRINKMKLRDIAHEPISSIHDEATSLEDNDYEQRAREIADNLTTVFSKVSEAEESEKSLREFQKKKLGRATFRNIVYSEGELEKSDLSSAPSWDNPHPFDPSKHLPPTHSRAIAPFVNTSDALQSLVELGVNLFEVDTLNPRLGRHLVRLDLDRDIKPRLQWLVNDLGFDPSELGEYLTRNPFFLVQNLDDMKTRVNYLEAKKFKKEHIVTIVREFRYWLNVDVKTMDARLGWIQKQFKMSGNQVRDVILMEPRIVMFGLGPLQRLVNLLNKELLFTPSELKRMFLEDPRLFLMDSKFIISNYHYVHRVMDLPNTLISQNPFLLRSNLSTIRNRHEFLKKLGRAHYDGSKGSAVDATIGSHSMENDRELIKMEYFLHESDGVFANKAANTYLAVYDQFLKMN